MNTPTISLVIATVSRPTLARSLASLRAQEWIPGDEVFVIGDGPQPIARELCGRFAAAPPAQASSLGVTFRWPAMPLRYMENPTQVGMWGHHARNWVLDAKLCRGDYLMALDDDDEYTPGAIAAARAAFAECPEPRPHIFRMSGHPSCALLWSEPVLKVGNLGTPCIAVPNDPARLGRYGHRYTGDFDFAVTTCAAYPSGPVWREEVVCRVRPAT